MRMNIFVILLFLSIQIHAQDSNNISENVSNETPLLEESSNNIPEFINSQVNAVLKTDTNLSNTTISEEISLLEEEEESEELDIEQGNFSLDNIIKAMIRSYPKIVQRVPRSENPYYPDLAVRIRGIDFYDVRGRLLPEHERKNWRSYRSNSVYKYPIMIPDPLARSKEEINTIRRQGSKSYRRAQKPTYYGFAAALYGMTSLSDTNTQIVKTRFLGRQVLIHQFAYEALNTIEKEVYELTNNLAIADEINAFLAETDTVYSFFWRTIAGSKSRSLHSYGVAIDLLDSRTKKPMYWLWRQNLKINWIVEPINIRWNPPDPVVAVFEKYGFLWGGKWNFYDTMHFEYKPEILLLNGYKVKFLSQEYTPIDSSENIIE